MAKCNFFIIHGIYGHPEENWFPWLKKELEKSGHEVIVPRLPTPMGQSLESWMKAIKQYEGKINEKTIMIGHSLGSAFILNYLEQADKEIKAAFLVAGYHKVLENEFKELNDSFVNKKFDWGRIIENCGNFFVVASDNDPYIPLEINRELNMLVDGELHVIKNGGHLNKKAGFGKFPKLLGIISKFIKNSE
ncbi:serine hydrolase family protein [Candidatus Woesearchaeota archaeon]|nr:serine hydrolase family protein [Candidatus Woesearchaeota archaeon]